MATVTTNTQTDLLAPPTLPPITRNMATGAQGGHLYTVVRTAASTLTVYRSTDSGGSWASFASFTHSGLQEWSSFVVDKYGYGHIAYRFGDGTSDSLWYRRMSISTATFSSGLQISASDANSGVIGSRWQGVDLGVVHNPNNTYAIFVAGAYTEGSTRYGLYCHGVSIDGAGTIYNNDGIIINNRVWTASGTAPGRSGVSVEIEHNGDGISSSTPHIWVSWGRTTLRMVKLSWQGSSVGWSGPSSSQTIRSGLTAQDYCAGRWDGSQWLMPVISPDDATAVRVYQRNQANTLTTSYDTPTHPTGNIRTLSCNYDAVNKNIRVYATGTSTAVLYFVDYTRATSTWGAWATVTATAVLGTPPTEWGVRRGGSSGNARMDVITAASGAPNTVTHTAQTGTSTPSTPTWDTTTVPYFNGGAADVAASLTLDWTFTDPDPGDTQGSYALSRQIGAGTLSYWSAATSTWGASEVQNSSATTAVTLASGWAAATDANYTYRVKVWDSTGTPSAAYSAGLVIVPSAKVNPTITAPTAAQVLNTDQVTVTWTVSEQTTRRVRLSTNPGGLVVFDSGFEADSSTSYTVPNRLATGTGWTVELTTKNLEGLASTAQTRNFTVAYAPPPATISTLLPVPASGWISVTSSALAPVGVQPAIVALDLWRRKKLYGNQISNYSMFGNVTGWTGVGASIAYSTVQQHDALGGAALVTPTGAAADSLIRWSTPFDQTGAIAAGADYTASAWVRPTTANKSIKIQVNWYNAATALISSAEATIAAPVAAAWQYLEVTGDPSQVAGAVKVAVSVGLTGTPAVGDTFYADEVMVRQESGDTGTRIATGLLPGTAVTDTGAASGIDYEYRWVATGANGTTQTGQWDS